MPLPNQIHRSPAKSMAVAVQQNGRSSHVKPRSPVIDLSGPGRLRTAHVLALCGLSHSTLYARLKIGAFPRPDGKDGGLNFWNTQTIRQYLQTQ